MIDIHDLRQIDPAPLPSIRFARVGWNLTYTGNGTVTHYIYRAANETPDQWYLIGTRAVVKPGRESRQEDFLDFEGSIPHGSEDVYYIRVDAFGSDGGYDSEQTSVYVRQPLAYIRIV